MIKIDTIIKVLDISSSIDKRLTKTIDGYSFSIPVLKNETFLFSDKENNKMFNSTEDINMIKSTIIKIYSDLQNDNVIKYNLSVKYYYYYLISINYLFNLLVMKLKNNGFYDIKIIDSMESEKIHDSYIFTIKRAFNYNQED